MPYKNWIVFRDGNRNRGEVGVILVNLSNETVCIENGDRIAQLVFAKIETIDWIEVNNTDATDRGTGGFGSTGIK